MRYCPSCLEEYEDANQTCAECKESLVAEEELAKRPEFHRVREEDPRDFAVAGPAEDPFEADAFTAALDEAGIPVMARMRRTGAVDAITDPVAHAWWEVLVPVDQVQKAIEIIARRKEELKAAEADSEKAAEEEEAEGESKTNG
ncbi:MAG: DUF2007 domain-containing protein [Deltaproteobacteria bacterium]|nr:DUF2007 domain-containing protein [Deltaproteobacteria bacterium]